MNKGKNKSVLRSLIDPKQYAVLGGEWRRGLKDLQDAVLQAFPNSAKSRDESATIGNPTQAIVTAEMMGKDLHPASHKPRNEMTIAELKGNQGQESAQEAAPQKMTLDQMKESGKEAQKTQEMEQGKERQQEMER